MKYGWETADIRHGRKVTRNGVEYMIGYLNGGIADKNHCLIDLRDGCVMKRHSTDELVAKLNDEAYKPVEIEDAQACDSAAVEQQTKPTDEPQTQE